jgi:hypothetical protein
MELPYNQGPVQYTNKCGLKTILFFVLHLLAMPSHPQGDGIFVEEIRVVSMSVGHDAVTSFHLVAPVRICVKLL